MQRADGVYRRLMAAQQASTPLTLGADEPEPRPVPPVADAPGAEWR